MDTTPVDDATAATWEAAEARAWADLYAAAPAEWAAEVGQGTRWLGDTLAIHWAVTGRRYFSRAIGLGVTAPATEAGVDDILALWERLGISMCLVQSMPHCAPAGYTDWLRERGLEPFDQQDGSFDRSGGHDRPGQVGARVHGRARSGPRPRTNGRGSCSASTG